MTDQLVRATSSESAAGSRVRYTELAEESMATLERVNAARLAQFGRHPLFELFDSGQMAGDPGLRAGFLGALYVWSVYFQRMLYARQSVCVDPALRELYAEHLREEFGHDRLLRERHRVAPGVYDPILEAAGAWFVMRMHGANEAVKIVTVHLVVESSCQVFGARTAPAFAADGPGYFDVHAEADVDHQEIGRDYLHTLAPAAFPELVDACGQAWDQVELIFDRLAALSVRESAG